MTERERNEFLAYLEELSEKVKGNRELSLDLLSRAGICTKDGKLTEPYKHLYIPRN